MKHDPSPQGQQPESSQAGCQGDAYPASQGRGLAGKRGFKGGAGKSQKHSPRWQIARHFRTPSLQTRLALAVRLAPVLRPSDAVRLSSALSRLHKIHGSTLPRYVKNINGALTSVALRAKHNNTQMDFRETIMTEWARLKQEAAALETLIISRGWLPEESKPGIAYMAEARYFLSDLLNDPLYPGEDFTSNDFVEFLNKKHGVENVNDASARGVFRSLETEGRIVTKTPGRGRLGAVYSFPVTKQLSADPPSPARKDTTM